MDVRIAWLSLLLCACGARSGLRVPEVRGDAAVADAGLADASDASLEGDAPWRCRADDDCDDGVFCNGEERCNERGLCVPGIACADAIACTVDACDEDARTCTHDARSDLCPLSHRCDDARGCIARAIAHDASRLYDIELPAGRVTEIASTDRTLTDVALARDGRYYAAVAGELLLLDVDDGATSPLREVPGAFNALDQGEDGWLYGASDDRVERFDVAGEGVDIIARLPAGYMVSGDLAVMGDRLLVTASRTFRGEDTLFEVLLPGGQTRAVGSTGEACLWGLAPFGELLYGFSCEGWLTRIDPATGRSTRLRALGVGFYGAAAR